MEKFLRTATKHKSLFKYVIILNQIHDSVMRSDSGLEACLTLDFATLIKTEDFEEERRLHLVLPLCLQLFNGIR